jgi:hypothetical protein
MPWVLRRRWDYWNFDKVDLIGVQSAGAFAAKAAADHYLTSSTGRPLPDIVERKSLQPLWQGRNLTHWRRGPGENGHAPDARSWRGIAMRVRRLRCYCPYCNERQWLWGLRPVIFAVCNDCQQPYLLDTKTIIAVWWNTLLLWCGAPLVIVLTGFCVVITKGEKLLATLVVFLPANAFAVLFFLMMLGIPIGLTVAAIAKSKAGKKGRRLKMIIREVSW